MRCVGALLVIIALVITAGAEAQSPQSGDAAFQERVLALFDDGKYREAADLLAERIALYPEDMISLYNAACAHARLNELDTAGDYLFRAVEAGFLDFDHIVRDPDLDNLREHATYLEILSIRDRAYEDFATRQLEGAKELFGETGYRYETDNDRRLNYATALDQVSHEEMRRMIEIQVDYLSRLLFERPPDYFTLIAIPTPEDYRKLISDPKIGGLYEHGHHRLLARDIGIMLRHELVHLMHWGHMMRIRQMHALWVQEGLATLFETYRASPNGGIRILPNQRHNMVKDLLSRNEHIPWRDLMTMPADKFMDQARETYCFVRSIFRYIESRGKLDEWYKNYIATWEDDPTGIAAFEQTFGMPLEKIEWSWRTWVRAQATIDDFIMPGDASLGVHFVENATNDGVLIEAVLNKSAAEEAGIEPGDIIVSIDGQPIRSHLELLSAIGARRVGEEVVLRARRNGEYLTFRAKLKPLR